MNGYKKLVSYFSGTVATALLSAAALTPATAGPCTGPGAPTTTQTKCITAIAIPGNPLKAFDISWVNPWRGEYYLADRSNAGVDIIDTRTLKFKRTIGGFVGAKSSNSISGPDGVVSHGRWLYAGDGDSTLKVIDLDDLKSPIKAIISTGGKTRVDEMALTTDGTLLLAANNAEDPPYATLFTANGDSPTDHTAKIIKLTVATSIIPAGAGLSLEQPAWDPTTKGRFYTSIPVIAGNPLNCNPDSTKGIVTCHGGLLVTDPYHATATPAGAYDPTTHTGVIALPNCSPNGAFVGVDDELALGCNPGNNPSDTQTTIISAKTTKTVSVDRITGADELYFNAGDNRFYLGASANKGGAVLGVIDAELKFLIETIPQSSGSHSVAADAFRNLIFVPQSAVDTTTVGAGICGGTSGCIAVYKSGGDRDEGDEGGHWR